MVKNKQRLLDQDKIPVDKKQKFVVETKNLITQSEQTK